MALSVTIQEREYELNCSEEFINQMEKISSNYKQLIAELQLEEAQIAVLEDGEPFFFIGNAFSFEGVKSGNVISLNRLIPNSNVL